MRFVDPSRAGSMLVTAALGVVLAGCGQSGSPGQATAEAIGSGATTSVAGSTKSHHHPRLAAPFRHRIPGMPAPLPGGVYAADKPGMMLPRLRHDRPLIYVPDSDPNGGHTTVISQRTHRIVRVLPTGYLDQHVTPAWNLKTLYVEASASDHLAKIDPQTGRMTGVVGTDRPYNLYFTPDGRQAIVMDEEHNQIVFTTPHKFKRQEVVSDPSCKGPNHADFSANGRYFVVSCEFSGELLKISTLQHKVVGHIQMPMPSMPQDVRLAPDGRSFFVADMGRDLLLRIPWQHFRITHRYRTLRMPHGIYFSRDQRRMFVTDRRAGAVQVFDLRKGRFTDTWRIPGGGSPDMGGLSADGRILWVSGRYNGVVYGFDTRRGKLIATIHVPGNSPHGLLVWPQPGRYSLGHTGEMR
ncbi:MAG: YncE family protein [Nocardioidaceae bacterium]|nr:YncE family protein [Nocardioidaceae bacterium]MCL2614289.1 YncE family protein [Nocardioidaceae bacterium]